jgi:bacteriorhodopsin
MENARTLSFAAHQGRQTDKEWNMIGTVLIVILVLALVGALPTWPHSRQWGYYPTGGLGVILLIVIILLLLGRI